MYNRDWNIVYISNALIKMVQLCGHALFGLFHWHSSHMHVFIIARQPQLIALSSMKKTTYPDYSRSHDNILVVGNGNQSLVLEGMTYNLSYPLVW